MTRLVTVAAGLLLAVACGPRWQPHDSASFPLVASHDLDCADCHDSGDAWHVEHSCGECHQSERPGGHFDGDCAPCHLPPTEWGDGVDHDERFPWPHHGVSECTSCHPNGGDYESFTCTDCHEHSRDRMNGEHHEIGSYTWDSEACYDCHPDGRGEHDR